MRIEITLRALKSFNYDKNYYSKAQGAIYSLFKSTSLEYLHDKKSYKFFCFSNIIPFSEKIKEGEEKKWIISTPLDYIATTLLDGLIIMKENAIPLNIGEMIFEIVDIDLKKPKIKKNFTVKTQTPIIIRIPERKYDQYNIPLKFRKKRYVYWRPMYKKEAFHEQLKSNMIKKFLTFHKELGENFKLDYSSELLTENPIISRVFIKNKEQIFVGSLWRFEFKPKDKLEKELILFNFDAGFGERNSYGFGFMIKSS